MMKTRLKKIGAILLGIVAAFAIYFYVGATDKPEEMEWGVTFAPGYAESFGFAWQDVYEALLDELQIDNIRVSAYWNMVEPQRDEFDFQALDYQVEEASRREVRILLALGRRLPRWPECHVPEWAKVLSESEQQAELLEYIPAVINRYKDNPHIVMWQVENEFFLRNFGECPDADSSFFSKEINLVHSLDKRPIVTSDSGELGGWIGTVRRGDVFGTTMYRIVHNKMIGFIKYPLAPVYYKRRFLLYKPFFRAKQVVNVELQAEPWAVSNLRDDPIETQYKSLSPQQFRDNIEYARASGVSPAYLWGSEWWYYMKEARGIDEFWQIAKELWNGD